MRSLSKLSNCQIFLAALYSNVKATGGNVVREAGPMKHGTKVLAFVEDSDGYKIEYLSPMDDS